MNNVCVEHDWSWYENDDYGCPVCYGIRLEDERIIALLEAEGCHCMPDPEAGKCYPHNLIAAIKGETE